MGRPRKVELALRRDGLPRRRKGDGPRPRDRFSIKGITEADYLRMQEAQGGACAICHSEQKPMSMEIDHCHATGVVRGLLCPRCNRGIGYFSDRADVLRAAAVYVALFQK